MCGALQIWSGLIWLSGMFLVEDGEEGWLIFMSEQKYYK